MTDQQADDRVVAGIREVVDISVNELLAFAARDEALAEFVPARRVLGVIPREARMRELGRVWRLGVFLLDKDGALYATGATTRAVEPKHPGYQSTSAEDRRGYRGAAYSSHFAYGETVNYDAHPIVLDPGLLRSSDGPLFVRGDRALVRWSAAGTDADATPLSAYLAERVDLLSHPPQGA